MQELQKLLQMVAMEEVKDIYQIGRFFGLESSEHNFWHQWDLFAL